MENLQVVINQTAGTISMNFEEMKSFLNQRLEEYKGAVFTDDSIKSAKSCTAQLRKEQSALKSRITEVKKEYMQPFDNFKEKADELVRLYDEPILFIDGQVKAYEERRKSEKREEIKVIYSELAQEVSEYIPLEKIYNSKWENVTYKKSDIKKEIYDLVVSTKQAIETINGMESEACEKALLMYKQDLSLTNAITYINNYERQRAEILLKEQERKRREEEERIRREEREKIEAAQQAEREKAIAVEEAKEQAVQEMIESLTPDDFTSKTNLYEYRMALNNDMKEKLEMYLDSVGIDWELM